MNSSRRQRPADCWKKHLLSAARGQPFVRHVGAHAIEHDAHREQLAFIMSACNTELDPTMGPANRVLMPAVADGGNEIAVKMQLEICVARSLPCILQKRMMSSCACPCTSASSFSLLQSPCSISTLAPAKSMVKLQQFLCRAQGSTC